MNDFDVIVIGGGVVGTAILRNLTAYTPRVLLLEKSEDVATGASRANSGIVHAGYDAENGTKKAFFNVKGCAMFPSLTEELHVPFRQIGSLVVAKKEGLPALKVLEERGINNGVKVSIIGRNEILALEPNVADDIEYALWAPEAGVVSPYKLTIAQADSAVVNGATVKLGEKVLAIVKQANGYVVTTALGTYTAPIVINAAGAGANEINALLGEERYEQVNAVGDYYVLDNTAGSTVTRVIFPLPDEKGKGILVAPTADGNVIYGPTSRKVPQTDAELNEVTLEGLKQVRDGIDKTFKAVNLRKVIRVYAGTRTAVGNDFIIEKSKKNAGYYMLLGICSPGLTSAPAIGEALATEIGATLHLTKKELLPLPPKFCLNKATPEEIAQKVKEDSAFGRIVCRCEKVTEGEIVAAIHSPVPATTVDAVKRRVRAGMGRCQGGFCAPRVMEILARELNIPYTQVCKGEKGSEIAVCAVKELL